LGEVKDSLASLSRKIDSFTDIMTDAEYATERAIMTQEVQRKMHGATVRFAGSSAAQVASDIEHQEFNKKLAALAAKK